SASIRRRTSSRSATGGSSPRTTRSSPRACGCSASTARRRRSSSSSWATTRASTRSMRRRCGSSCRTSTRGRASGARPPSAIPPFYKHLLSWQTFALVLGIKLAVFVLFGFYNRWWRYVSTRDMWGAARGVVVASLLVDLTLYAFPPDRTSRLPRGIALIDMLLLLAFVAGSRLLARTLI